MPRLALLLAALLAPAALAARTLEPPRAAEKWITLRADEFRFVSNVSPAKTLEIARDLLRMRAAVGAVTQLRVRSSLPTTVFIFADERTFGGYRDAVLQNNSDSVVGLFSGTQTDNFILLRSDVRSIDRMVYHELTHYFVRNTSGPLPLWISEGIAEYYSTFQVAGSDVHIGRAIPEHVLWLRGAPMIPLRELFETTATSPIYNEDTRRGVFYAQSWALFHYLMSDLQRRAKFSYFLSLLGERKTPDEAFQTAFAMEYSQLEQELRRYTRRDTFAYVRHSVGELPSIDLPKPEPMPHADVLFALGHLLTHSNSANGEAAERHLRAALAASPKHAGVHADLGWLYEQSGRPAEADAAYRAAVELGSQDAGVYLYAGLSLLRRFAGKRTDTIPAAELRLARTLLQRSTELDPTMALAWTGLGTTYIGERDSAPGIAALEKSLRLAPGNEEASFHLLQLYASAGRQADAKRLFDGLVAYSTDPELVANAREALLMGEVREVERLVNERKVPEATAAAKALLARTTDPSLQEYLGEVLEEVERITATNLINQAISQANAGHHAAALKTLDAVLPTIGDPMLRDEALKFRADIAARVKKK